MDASEQRRLKLLGNKKHLTGQNSVFLTNVDNLDMKEMEENGELSGRQKDNLSAIRSRVMRKAPSSAHKAHTKMLVEEDVTRKIKEIEEKMRRATEKTEMAQK